MNRKMENFAERLWDVKSFYDLCSAMAEFADKDICGIAKKNSSFRLFPNPTGKLEVREGTMFCFEYDTKSRWFSNIEINFIHVSNGIPYFLKAKIHSEYDGRYGPMARRYSESYELISIEFDKWKPVTKLLPLTIFLHTKDEIETIMETYFKYAKDTVDNTELADYVSYEQVIMAPQIEQLWKAGYKEMLSSLRGSSDYEAFNRATKKASKLKDIFKMPKYVYQMLKDESNMQVWDSYRKIAKIEGITEDILKELYHGGWDSKHIEKMQRILKRTYKDRSVFSFWSLINYMNRVDQFEAIERDEALMYLDDYLRMCQVLEMKPRIDGDSLKREHDIAARLINLKRDEKLNEELKEPCRKLSKYDWSDGTFEIRTVKDYDDLLDEAKQQHSCVASYARSIIEGHSAIFVMRRAVAPNRSLITVDLVPDGSRIRQKLLAYNKKIHNKAQTDFLNEWVKHCKEVNRAELLAM